MLPDFLVVAVAVSCLGGAARGLTGFGSALVMAPLMMMAVPPETALAVITLVNLGTSGQFLRRSIAQCERTVIWPMVAAALPAIPLGV